MQNAKTKISPSIRPRKKSVRIHVTMNETLLKRAFAYSEKSGIAVTALLRSGLDLLLKQNNF